MHERRLDFERLDSRDLYAVVGIGADAETLVENRRVVPVTIDDASGVRAAEIHLRYDPAAWHVDPAAIKSGSAWSQGGAAMTKVDPAAGEITVFVFAAEDLPANQGSLVDLEFSPHDPTVDDAATNSPTVELKSVRLNEGSIPADLCGADDSGEVADLGDEEDYINPRVRAMLAQTSPPATVALPSKDSTVMRMSHDHQRDNEQFRLTRDPNTPMGPLSLLPRRLLPVIKAPSDVATVATVEPATSQAVASPWTLIFSPEEQRVRRRAA
ncbi:cohesin domain-containing protein [Anatilimnocola floriformis]|uniref:cohesin domain-containing protein n=1 Tax=Anatilimnocola floriformis TaxID=2948575 RepID=UPI0020C417D0|nr:cohesin domain-containing protein [Anatilimnocola floriformis]